MLVAALGLGLVVRPALLTPGLANGPPRPLASALRQATGASQPVQARASPLRLSAGSEPPEPLELPVCHTGLEPRTRRAPTGLGPATHRAACASPWTGLPDEHLHRGHRRLRRHLCPGRHSNLCATDLPIPVSHRSPADRLARATPPSMHLSVYPTLTRLRQLRAVLRAGGVRLARRQCMRRAHAITGPAARRRSPRWAEVH